jgi:hypothetical protein
MLRVFKKDTYFVIFVYKKGTAGKVAPFLWLAWYSRFLLMSKVTLLCRTQCFLLSLHDI